ncbi:hypothetical protein GCM10027521_19940 [Amycolatopsis cihanbeyliensis]
MCVPLPALPPPGSPAGWSPCSASRLTSSGSRGSIDCSDTGTESVSGNGTDGPPAAVATDGALTATSTFAAMTAANATARLRPTALRRLSLRSGLTIPPGSGSVKGNGND